MESVYLNFDKSGEDAWRRLRQSVVIDEDSAMGCFLGAAVGDAAGAVLEFGGEVAKANHSAWLTPDKVARARQAVVGAHANGERTVVAQK